jgi:Domain of unknown function (DUF4386)
MEEQLNSQKRTARLGGLLYFFWTLTGLYGLMYLPSQTIVKGDAVATANKILANEFLFRTGVVNDLISSILWIFMVLVLYRLFKQVNERHAKLLVAMVMVQIPVTFVMGAFNIATLMIIKGEILTTFQLNQRQDLAMLFLKIGDYGNLTLEMFWGLWLFPLAILIYKSRFLPRFLGIWLAITGFTYVVLSVTGLLFPEYYNALFKVSFPAMLGELAFMLWLLIKGVNVKSQAVQPQ